MATQFSTYKHHISLYTRASSIIQKYSMSFKFDWSPFLINDENFDSISAVLTKALNRGPKPEAVVGHIKLKNLNVGSIPPRLHLVEVTDITDDSFKGKFRIEYDGNASISLQTFVEVCILPLFIESLDI